MSKICLIVLVAFLAVTTVFAQSEEQDFFEKHGIDRTCAPSVGKDCTSSSDCCGDLICHSVASRCSPNITVEMLLEIIEKLKHIQINAHKKNF
ncbi:omega-conotoxin-like protein 1 [Aphidius gifuensis]|uniref:omega-conotoxin-like protein 1 n=1 Tax=Aphidius gifuensis TaxID=684658 RepID=UPI001CDC2882|nr:omega-conotoxin-like protein 1 [Aphidius gifuensis]